MGSELTIDTRVAGSFDANGVGHFLGKDTLNGKPIIVVFRWDARDKNRPLWGAGVFAGQGQNLGMEFLQRFRTA